MKNKKQRKIYLYLLIILGLTMGFALLSTTLKINGTAGIKKNTWSIHWDDESIVETSGSVTATTPANVVDTDKKIVSFEVDFDLPGDYYEFTVDAVNDGTIDGIIDSVKKEYYEPGATEPSEVPEYINYTVTYAENGETPKQGDVLKANGGKIKYKVRVEFKSNSETIPDTTVSGTYKFEPEYIQHKDESVDIGDIVLYNPVSMEFCDSVSETNCFEWVVLNKNENNEIKDLMYLREISNLVNTTNAFTVLENYISGWNSRLQIDSSYDLPESTSMPTFSGYEYGKARLPLSSEITNKVFKTLKAENIAISGENSVNMILTINSNTNWGMYYIYDGEGVVSGGAPLGANMTSSDSTKYYVHPVINIDGSASRKTCADFENDSWDEINSQVSANLKSYPLGCEKTVDVGSYGIHKVRIANNSRPSECSATDFSQSACGFVLEFTDILTLHRMNPLSHPDEGDEATITAGDGSIGGWKDSEMRNVVMPQIYNQLPSDLKNIIINTKTVSGHSSNESSNIVVENDKLYLLGNKDAGFTIGGVDSSLDQNRILDYYNNQNVSRVKKYNNEATDWWMRSASPSSVKYYTRVGETGNPFNSHSDQELGVSPAFRIK